MKYILVFLLVLLWSVVGLGQTIPPHAVHVDAYEAVMWELQPGQVTIDTSKSFVSGDTLQIIWEQATVSGGVPGSVPFPHVTTGITDTLLVANTDSIWLGDQANADLGTVSLNPGPWAVGIRAVKYIQETNETLYSNWDNPVYIYLKSPLYGPVIIHLRLK